MPSRWERMVERATKSRPGSYGNVEVVKLLSRQHASVVRMVKKLPSFNCYDIKEQAEYRVVRINDILAALAKEKGRKK